MSGVNVSKRETDLVSRLKLDKNKAYSKTMRLDILPSDDDVPGSGASQILRRHEINADDLTLTPTILEHLYVNAYDAMLLTNLNGEILSGNQRAREFLQCDSVVGLNMLDIISGADETLLEGVIETLQRERFVRLHAWCRRGTGDFFPAEIAAHYSLMDESHLLCFFIHDITWRKETEDRLQMADVAFRTTQAGIVVITLDGTMIFVNPALKQLFGLGFEESLHGQSIANHLANREILETLLQEIQNGNAWHGRVDCTLPDGSRGPTKCAAVGYNNSDGDLIGAVLSFHDLSDLLRADEAERQVERNRVMMESIGTICHHLGQPSTVLLSSIEMLTRMDDTQQEERKELLDMSLAAAETLGHLLRQLNDLRTYRSEPYLAQSEPDGDQIVTLEKDDSAQLPDGDDMIG